MHGNMRTHIGVLFVCSRKNKKIKSSSQGKSDIWTNFSVVTDDTTNKLDFVRCYKCAKVSIYPFLSVILNV